MEEGIGNGMGPQNEAALNPTPTKGYGLKRWRRIRRDLTPHAYSIAEPHNPRGEGKQRMDSENSDDRRNQSSTAASAPWRLRRRGPRGGQARFEQESSPSTVESRLEVRNFFRGSLDFDLLEKNNRRSEGHRRHMDLNPFVESIVLLQDAQEALEKEIYLFGEIGKKPVSTLNDSFSQFEKTEGNSSPILKACLVELNQKIAQLEHKLEETSATIKAKESEVHELEAILNTTHSSKKESNDIQLLQQENREIEFELELMLKKKIEAEIEYLTITRTPQSWKVEDDQIALLEEQKSLAWDQVQMMLKLKDAENKAINLKRQAEGLEYLCKELSETEEALNLQNSTCKFSLCFLIQFVMLFIAFGLFLMQLSPFSSEFVPT